MNVQKNVSLAPYNSWRVGGVAEYFAQPRTVKGVKEVIDWANLNSQKLTILGGGSNVLISDKGVSGLVLHTGELKEITVIEQDKRLLISSGAGVLKSELVKVFLKYKLNPALFLAGLPGDVGGGIVMNAGIGHQATPKEFVEITDWVDVLDLNIKELKRYKKDELKWSYRSCVGWQPGIILQAGLSWPLEENPEIAKQVIAANRQRILTQPLNLPSCGSVFKNPEGHRSGQLIEQAGLKGYSIGGAQVSAKHANFIVNVDNARASDIHEIIEHIKLVIKKNSNIDLHTEVVYLGEW